MNCSNLNIYNNSVLIDDNTDIKVLQYLPIEDKNDLITIALQNAEENGYYNLVKLDMYFDLHLVYMYTNLIFNTEDKVDEEKLYDTLKVSGFIDAIKNNINEKELIYLQQLLVNTEQKMKD